MTSLLLPEHTGSSVLESRVLELAHLMATLIQAYSFDLPKEGNGGTLSTFEGAADYGDGAGESVIDDGDEATMYFKVMLPMADMLNADAKMANVRGGHPLL
jgi:hypothetical protein